MNDNLRSQRSGALSSRQTCENCIYFIRHKTRQDVAVCTQHLDELPLNNSSACNLHKHRHKNS